MYVRAAVQIVMRTIAGEVTYISVDKVANVIQVIFSLLRVPGRDASLDAKMVHREW